MTTISFNSRFLTHDNINEVMDAFLLACKNRRKYDKFSLAYFITMIDHYQGLYADQLKRDEIYDRLKALINENTIYRVIQSEHTATEIKNILNNN